MRRFLLILAGQLFAYLGSYLARFALSIWVLQRTGSMSAFSLVLLAYHLPPALIAPLAGALADRWDRRPAMLTGLAGSCVCSVILALLALQGVLAPWSALLLITLASCFAAFHVLAFESMIVVLVPPETLNRANGLVQFGHGLAQLTAPVSAGFMLPVLGLEVIYAIHAITSLLAMAMLLVVHVPRSRPEAAHGDTARSLLRDASMGWRHVRAHRGLVALLLLSGFTQLGSGMVEVLFTPLVLSFASPRTLGIVVSMGGIGLVLGSLVVSTWRGPVRLIHGVLGFTLVQGLILLVAVARPSPVLAIIGCFGFLFSLPFLLTYSQTIWQSVVPLDIQGRVFALRMMVNRLAFCAAAPLGGWLGDHVFEPLMAADGALASTLGRLMGVGPGRGAALYIGLVGVLTIIGAVSSFLYTPLRTMDSQPERERHDGNKRPWLGA